jgi:hypothetical protein
LPSNPFRCPTTACGFLRAANGTNTSFDVPGAPGTCAEGVSKRAIAGYFTDSAGNAHGFVRTR